MNVSIIYPKQVLLTIFLVICFQTAVFSQWTNRSSDIQSGLFVGFNIGPSQSQIINEGTSSVSGLVSNKMTTFIGSAEIGYFFSKYIGLSSGIGFDSYNSQLFLAGYQNKFNAIDSENETYERQVSGTGIKEDQKIGFISVPLCLNIRFPFTKTVGFFLQPGINLEIPISKNYTSSGAFTFKGYYPAYNVLLEDLPDYGFPSNVISTSKGELELKSFDVNMIASAGFDFYVQKKIQLSVAAFYSKSLSNISAYSSPDKFQLSTDVNKINSLMGGSGNVSVQSMGILISLRYYLKSHI